MNLNVKHRTTQKHRTTKLLEKTGENLQHLGIGKQLLDLTT